MVRESGDTWGETRWNRNIRTIYYELGSYQKVADKFGVSVSTAYRWVNAQVSGPQDESLEEEAFEEVEEIKVDDDRMVDVLLTANKKQRQRKVRQLNELGREGVLSPDTVEERKADLREYDEAELEEEYRSAYERARESDDPDDWKVFRAIHKERGGS